MTTIFGHFVLPKNRPLDMYVHKICTNICICILNTYIHTFRFPLFVDDFSDVLNPDSDLQFSAFRLVPHSGHTYLIDT